MRQECLDGGAETKSRFIGTRGRSADEQVDVPLVDQSRQRFDGRSFDNIRQDAIRHRAVIGDAEVLIQRLPSRLDSLGLLLGDFANLFTAMVANPQRFMRHAQVFRLFDYGRCLDATHENHRHTAHWMRLTSALTRYEAQACLEMVDFSRHRRMLDVGGNSGEFLMQACRRNPGLSGTVFDLPVVCDVGLEHVLAQPECPRIGFLKADVRQEPLPTGYDLISFKSMLHDWPIENACAFLEKAARALLPGGTLLIYERGPLEVQQHVPPFSALPLVMFFRSYRSPIHYLEKLQALGLVDLRCQVLHLDTPFFIVTARKPAA